MIKQPVKEEVVRLRTEERLSIDEIVSRTGVSKGTVSLLLRPFSLSQEEVSTRFRERGPNLKTKQHWEEPSKHFRAIKDNNQKGRVAEAAVAFRLALLGLDYYKADVSYANSDFLVDLDGNILRIQVKWARIIPNTGLPFSPLRRSDGRHATKNYLPNDFDVLVIYNLFNDTAYVFSGDEVANRVSVTVKPDCAEAWDKLWRPVRNSNP